MYTEILAETTPIFSTNAFLKAFLLFINIFYVFLYFLLYCTIM